jgi:predicted secreted protein
MFKMNLPATAPGARRAPSGSVSMRLASLAPLVFAALLATPAPACAQVRSIEGSGPILRLEAQTSREVVDDTAYAVFFVEREGPQPAEPQSAANAVLQSALAALKADDRLRVRSGNYSTHPRYSREGRIESWRVRAELVAEATDPAAISQASATLSGRMNVGSIGFRLSPELRTRTEKALTGEAADNFYERARSAARALAYGGVELVEANYGTGTPAQPVPLARAMAASAAPAAAVPVPLEPGRSVVTVTFSGTVRLKP